MIRFLHFLFFTPALFYGHTGLWAQQKQAKPSYQVAPFLVKDATGTNRMNHYLILCDQNYFRKPEKAQAYADSAIALGSEYGNRDQWLYAKIIRVGLASENTESTDTESSFAGLQALLARNTNPRLQGLFYYTWGSLAFRKKRIDEGIRLLEKAQPYYEEAGDPYFIGRINHQIGERLSREKNDLGAALEYFRKAERHYTLLGDKRLVNNVLQSAAGVYNRLGRHEEAVSGYYKIIHNNETLGYTNELARNYYNLGLVYLDLKNFEKAGFCFHRSIGYSEETGQNLGLAYNYSQIGATFMGKPYALDSTLFYFEKALTLFEELKEEAMVLQVKRNLSRAYGRKGDYARAFSLIRDQLNSSRVRKNEKDLFYTYVCYADLLSKVQEELPELRVPDKTRRIHQYLDSARHLAEGSGELQVLTAFWRSYAEINQSIENYEAAFTGTKTYIQLRDSAKNLSKAAAIIRLETEFKFARQQDSLSYINQLAGEQLARQHLIGRHQNQLLLNLNQESQLRQLTLDSTEANLNLQKAEDEQLQRMLTIANQEQQLKQASLDEVRQKNKLQQLRLRQQWLLGLTLLAGVGGLSGFVYYRNKSRQNQVKLRLERQVSEAMLQSMHSQMNPHFIFNSLASVRAYMAANEPRKATRYLNNFAGLIRRILNSSQEGAISFAEELETIRLYLRLEQERYKQAFSFSISRSTEVAAETLLVPALFLQAYVEYAVSQAMRQPKGQARIELEVEDRVAHLRITVKVGGPASDGDPANQGGSVSDGGSTSNGGSASDGQQVQQSVAAAEGPAMEADLGLSLQRLQQFFGPAVHVELKDDASSTLVIIAIPKAALKYQSSS